MSTSRHGLVEFLDEQHNPQLEKRERFRPRENETSFGGLCNRVGRGWFSQGPELVQDIRIPDGSVVSCGQMMSGSVFGKWAGSGR